MFRNGWLGVTVKHQVTYLHIMIIQIRLHYDYSD